MNNIEEFYRDNYNRLVNTILRKVGGHRDIAEDVVQESFTRAVKFYPAFNPELGDFSSWFNSIMYNTLRDVQRLNKTVIMETPQDISILDVLEVDSLDLSPTLRSTIIDAIEKTKNEKHKRILSLFFITGYTSKEISIMETGVSQSNVTTIVMRFKKLIN